jgi:hypothetical protein
LVGVGFGLGCCAVVARGSWPSFSQGVGRGVGRLLLHLLPCCCASLCLPVVALAVACCLSFSCLSLWGGVCVSCSAICTSAVAFRPALPVVVAWRPRSFSSSSLMCRIAPPAFCHPSLSRFLALPSVSLVAFLRPSRLRLCCSALSLGGILAGAHVGFCVLLAWVVLHPPGAHPHLSLIHIKNYSAAADLRAGGDAAPGDRTEVLCAVRRLVVVRPVGAAPVRCVYSRPEASPQADFMFYITRWLQHWRNPGQAQAGAPAVPST